MIDTNRLTEARGYIDHADRLFSETYPVSEDPKLFIPTLKLLKRGLGLIETDKARDILATVSKVLDSYDERVVEFPRGTTLVFADEQMRTDSISSEQVAVAINETKHAYSEAYE